jgi:hypothetical protein
MLVNSKNIVPQVLLDAFFCNELKYFIDNHSFQTEYNSTCYILRHSSNIIQLKFVIIIHL